MQSNYRRASGAKASANVVVDSVIHDILMSRFILLVVRYIGLVIADGDVCVDFGAGSGHLGLLVAYLWPKTKVQLHNDFQDVHQMIFGR